MSLRKRFKIFCLLYKPALELGGGVICFSIEDSHTSHSSDDELTEVCCLHISELNKSCFLTCLFQRAVTI